MTTAEHLAKIRARCVELSSIYDNAEPHSPLPAVAGWRATIAAIDGLNDLELSFETDGKADETLDAILAAWPEDLL
jgi:hypothetical protein